MLTVNQRMAGRPEAWPGQDSMSGIGVELYPRPLVLPRIIGPQNPCGALGVWVASVISGRCNGSGSDRYRCHGRVLAVQK